MAENETPQTPNQASQAEQPVAASQPTQPAAAASDAGPVAYGAGGVPMTEEFDRAKWTLPPPKIIGVGLLVFAVIAAVVFFLARATPSADGKIENVNAVTMADNTVMVGINVSFKNAMKDKSLWLRSASAELTKADGQKVKDTAASAVDFDRYFQAFPALKQNAIEPLQPETKLAPGATTRGMIIVSFPVDKAAFDQRKNLAVILDAYDQLPVAIEQSGNTVRVAR